MAVIEGFRVQNYRALRDVTLGKLSSQQTGEPLTPFTVVIGKNGSGKSTLFDAFGFLADCLSTDVISVHWAFCSARAAQGLLCPSC
jgi:AAA15 family ATPase/GTPase